MFDEKVIKEKIVDLQNQRQNMKESVIKRARMKYEEYRLSMISEKSLDQTIILNRET